jgi:hypothetical protein
MERGLTYEEKIRRAEEIYARRNQNNMGRNITTVNIRENKKKSVLKKMILQMLICIAMYGVFYLINTTNYAFSDDVTGNVREVLSYDIDLVKTYQNISQYFQSLINEQKQEDEQEKTEDTAETEETDETDKNEENVEARDTEF